MISDKVCWPQQVPWPINWKPQMKRETRSCSPCWIPRCYLERPPCHPLGCKSLSSSQILPLNYTILKCSGLQRSLFYLQPDLHTMCRLCRSGVYQHHNVRKSDRPWNPARQFHWRHHCEYPVYQWPPNTSSGIQRKAPSSTRHYRTYCGVYIVFFNNQMKIRKTSTVQIQSMPCLTGIHNLHLKIFKEQLSTNN